MRVLVAGERGAVFLLAWGSFRAVLPTGANFEEFEALEYGRQVGPVSALLLADQGYAASNPPEWIANLRPQLALLVWRQAIETGCLRRRRWLRWGVIRC